MSTTVTTVKCACGVAQKRARQQAGPRMAPGESLRSAAQFALWVHVTGAQQESPPLYRRTESGARSSQSAGTCRCRSQGRPQPKNCSTKSPLSPPRRPLPSPPQPPRPGHRPSSLPLLDGASAKRPTLALATMSPGSASTGPARRRSP